MCGRFVSTSSPEQIASIFNATLEAEPVEPNYNVAPTNGIIAVAAASRSESAPPAVRAFHWGLVPVWAKDTKIGSSMINARSETLAEKPTFKGLLLRRRCIIPIDAFYEWQSPPSGSPLGAKGKPLKQPMFIHRADNQLLAVAGLWSAWRDKAAPDDAPWLHSCTIITTSANTTMAPVHDRMPAILTPGVWSRWLDPAFNDASLLAACLVPAPDDVLEMYPVSTLVNNVRNKGAELIERVVPTLPG